jgi:5,10-methylene-tetrahydrofolate dehydrogenase/methenyl tetrahydrofolate cyclohydrolase
VIDAIDRERDVDGFPPKMSGICGRGKALVPCTPYGCLCCCATRCRYSQGRATCSAGRVSSVNRWGAAALETYGDAGSFAQP